MCTEARLSLLGVRLGRTGRAVQVPPGDAATWSRSGFPASKLTAPSWVSLDHALHVSLVQTEGTGVTEITEKALGWGQEI